MSLLRDRQSMVYRRVGVFRFREILDSQGIESPALQIAVTARFIVQVLGPARLLPDPEDAAAAQSWITGKLMEALPSLSNNILDESLERIFALSLEAVDWTPYEDFAELLHITCGPQAYESALNRLSRRGFAAWELDLLALEDEFVQLRLPRATRNFDLRLGVGKEIGWLAQVFYRFTLRAAIRDRSYRQSIESLDRFAADSAADDLLHRHVEAEYLRQVRESLEDLPDPERTAVRLYFGIASGREATVKEVARDIRSTEHLARVAIVRGLTRLMVRLNVRGVLTHNEFELLRLLYLDGLDQRSAADRLGIHLNDVRRIEARTGRMLRSVLRSRTFPASLD